MWCARERVLLCLNDVRLCAIVCNRAPLEQAERVAAVRRVAELREVDDGAARVGRRHGSRASGSTRPAAASLNFAEIDACQRVDRSGWAARAHVRLMEAVEKCSFRQLCDEAQGEKDGRAARLSDHLRCCRRNAERRECGDRVAQPEPPRRHAVEWRRCLARGELSCPREYDQRADGAKHEGHRRPRSEGEGARQQAHYRELPRPVDRQSERKLVEKARKIRRRPARGR